MITCSFLPGNGVRLLKKRFFRHYFFSLLCLEEPIHFYGGRSFCGHLRFLDFFPIIFRFFRHYFFSLLCLEEPETFLRWQIFIVVTLGRRLAQLAAFIFTTSVHTLSLLSSKGLSRQTKWSAARPSGKRNKRKKILLPFTFFCSTSAPNYDSIKLLNHDVILSFENVKLCMV